MHNSPENTYEYFDYMKKYVFKLYSDCLKSRLMIQNY